MIDSRIHFVMYSEEVVRDFFELLLSISPKMENNAGEFFIFLL